MRLKIDLISLLLTSSLFLFWNKEFWINTLIILLIAYISSLSISFLIFCLVNKKIFQVNVLIAGECWLLVFRNPGTYAHDAVCLSCPPGCQSCKESQAASPDCESCLPSFYHFEGECLLECPKGTTKNDWEHQCTGECSVCYIY